MLPKADGFTVAQHLRRAHVSTPILLLTARDGARKWAMSSAGEKGLVM